MFQSPYLSLKDLLGADYLNAVIEGQSAFGLLSKEEGNTLAEEKVDFFPAFYQEKNRALLHQVGKPFIPAFSNQQTGAPTNAFAKASHQNAAPVSGFGCYRVGEDGRLYLIGKSEHYHASLGHAFPGYRLIDNARKLHILNATHNNTRGYVTRLLEQELVRCANGLEKEDRQGLQKILQSQEPKVLNRVINLETGSIACEAGMKMMLARFYPLDKTYPAPRYAGKIPVFLVMADQTGTSEANYHGTSVIAQTFRNMWREYYKKIESAGVYKVVPVKINDIQDFKEKITTYNSDCYKTAGFLHEIVLMNYGGIRLTKEFLQQAHCLCRETDTPTMVDEIQSCMWYPGMFLFRLYGLNPDFVILGKGFPGGEYPASKILTTAEMDTLNQFGALVTNGQEELASLSYLITMRFSQENSQQIAANGCFFEQGLKEMACRHSEKISGIEGEGLLAAVHFSNLEVAARFAKLLNDACIDASAQVYKATCPPAVLLKPPLIADETVLGYLIRQMEQCLMAL